MQKILLVSLPVCSIQERYFTIAYLFGIIKKTSWTTRYVDLNNLIYLACPPDFQFKSDWIGENHVQIFEKIKDLARTVMLEFFRKEITDHRPDLIGVSLMNSNRLFGGLVVEVLKEINVKVPVIFGGPDCFPREHNKGYFEEEYTPDIILQGEGEESLPQFLKDFSETGSIRTAIPGFVYKDANGGLIDTGLPPLSYLKHDPVYADYGIFDYSNINCEWDNNIFTFCSKGCINECAFCSESRNYQPYRRRKASEVINEIESNLKKIPPESRKKAKVTFRDSIFNASPAYVKEICELIIQKRLKVRWYCLAGFRVPLTEELLDLMTKSGCINIFFGLESASQRVIDLMGKNFDITVAQRTIEDCVKYGVDVNLPIINGFPGEGTRDFLQSMAFIFKYRAKAKFVYSITCGIFRKTPLSSFPEDFFIEKVEEVRYELKDGYNVFEVRQVRQLINDALVKNQKIETFAALTAFDFNKPQVAAELAQILYFLGSFLGRWDDCAKMFFGERAKEEVNPNIEDEIGSYRHIEYLVPGRSLKHWLRWDKNNPNSKKIIQEYLGKLVEDTEKKILDGGSSAFVDFRNFLYTFEKSRKLRKPPVAFKVLSKRFSKYDKGMHLIFEGNFVCAFKKNANLSRIEASCGSYYFDVHHCLKTSVDHRNSEGEEVIKFWGKVQKKMLCQDSLVIKLVYSDGSSDSFGLDLREDRPKKEKIRSFLAKKMKLLHFGRP